MRMEAEQLISMVTTMRTLTTLCASFLLMLAATFANATDYQYTVTITPPTKYTDGTALDPATDIQEYRIYAVDSGSVITSGIKPSAGTIQVTLTLTQAGCQKVAATAVATNGLESAMSNTAQKCVRIPAAPTLTVGPLVHSGTP